MSQHNSQALYTLDKGAGTANTQLPASTWIEGFPTWMLPPCRYLTLCREKAQAEAADISELPVCTHHNGIPGIVSQPWQV